MLFYVGVLVLALLSLLMQLKGIGKLQALCFNLFYLIGLYRGGRGLLVIVTPVEYIIYMYIVETWIIYMNQSPGIK
jgi:hypothetical protein